MELRNHKALKGRTDHRQGCQPLLRISRGKSPEGVTEHSATPSPSP